ncbi:hypothetical protein LCL85_13045 [Vibrio alginolyticus]|nr:hypothetical protein [Vibrio alginolyticus]
MIKKILAFTVLFGLGYWLPDILNLDKKMEFSDAAVDPTLFECEIRSNRCSSGGFDFELIDGSFTALERTTFTLQYQGKPVSGDILVTSDDQLIGTLISQVTANDKDERQVLIPYCGNPIMKIIVIDAQSNKGVIITPQVS